jgi:hypothetical protein
VSRASAKGVSPKNALTSLLTTSPDPRQNGTGFPSVSSPLLQVFQLPPSDMLSETSES